MKRYSLIIFLLSLLALPALSQKKNAGEVLEQTSENFKKSGGMTARFDVRVSERGKLAGTAQGTIKVLGDKFYLETSEVQTWFDGETQWSYRTANDEVNISNPTEEELQSVNPYALLSLYKQGYSYKMGSAVTYLGKSVYEVELTARDKKKDISRLTLYITRDAYQPLFIVALLRDGSQNEITVRDYQTGQKHADATFVFDPGKYPGAEIIDLR